MAGDELTAVASEDYRGKKTGFYTIRITNQRLEMVALFRGRAASRAEKLL
jgi:acyl-coenzyme A thioesterase PaaI-like protein